MKKSIAEDKMNDEEEDQMDIEEKNNEKGTASQKVPLLLLSCSALLVRSPFFI